MLDKSSNDVTAAVRNVFVDPRFHRIRSAIYCFFGDIDGVRVGIAVASKSQRFATSTEHVLNKSDDERLIAALDAGRLDEGYVVTAATDANGNLVFIDAMEARKFAAEILVGKTPLSGKLGEFFLVSPNFTSDDEEF